MTLTQLAGINETEDSAYKSLTGNVKLGLKCWKKYENNLKGKRWFYSYIFSYNVIFIPKTIFFFFLHTFYNMKIEMKLNFL